MQKRRSTSKAKDVVVSLDFIKDAVISNIYAMKLVGNEQDIVDIDIGMTNIDGKVELKIYYRKEDKSKTKKD